MVTYRKKDDHAESNARTKKKFPKEKCEKVEGLKRKERKRRRVEAMKSESEFNKKILGLSDA